MPVIEKKIQSFKDLEVWKKAHEFVLRIYQSTQNYPEKEKFGIISQIRRAAVSIPTNLAEGGKRSSRKDYAHFVNIAEASLEEVKYLLLLSKDLIYLKIETYDDLIMNAEEIGRMLFGLRKSLLNS